VFNKYYQDELQFLRELGEEFARAHPTAAHYLSGPSRDPDVERMLEGFAFLAARVRHKLDDEFPELTHGLMHMLWPHYLRPVPSMAVLEFSPVMAAMRQTQTVPRGCEVRSVDVEGTSCRFRTSCAVDLHPLSLDEVAMETRSSGASRLRLTFKIWQQAKPESLRLDRLRLFLHGDPATSFALYLHLLRHVEEARLLAGATAPDRGDAPWRPVHIEPTGFGEDEALLPYPPTSFPGYRLLQEYFALPEKFLFVDLVGLGRLAELAPGDRFTVDIRFDRALPASLRPSREEIRLYCAPIVNLFDNPGDPVRADRGQTEYRIRPQGRDPLHYEVFTVDRVGAIAPGAGEERDIPSFHDFRPGQAGGGGPYHHTRLRPSVVDERLDTYVAIVDSAGGGTTLEAETLTFDLTCTNRRLAEALRVGDINLATGSSPAFVQFRNLTAPTTSVTPSMSGDLQWRLISHLSLNYASLVDVAALRGVLELYNTRALRDPRAARANALRLEGLHEVRAEPAAALVDGALVRGTAVTVDVLEDHFAGDGDLFLFGTLLNEFLSLHGTLNSFTQVQMRGLQKGEILSWPHRIGRSLL
jgi:type VI secretion system protein ImpG